MVFVRLTRPEAESPVSVLAAEAKRLLEAGGSMRLPECVLRLTGHTDPNRVGRDLQNDAPLAP